MISVTFDRDPRHALRDDYLLGRSAEGIRRIHPFGIGGRCFGAHIGAGCDARTGDSHQRTAVSPRSMGAGPSDPAPGSESTSATWVHRRRLVTSLSGDRLNGQ